MVDQITGGGQADGKAHAFPMPQDQADNAPVVNIPPNAVPPQMANAPHPYEQQMTPIVVDGVTQMVDHNKLVELAQKGVSSNSRFQEAAAKSKEAESAIALKADMELLAETGDVNAFRRAGALMGLSGDEIEEAARIVYEQDGGDSASPDENDEYDRTPQASGNLNLAQRLAQIEAELVKTKAQLSGRQATKFGDLDETLQTVIVDVEQTRVDKIIQKVLDSDQVLGYYMDSYDTKGQAAIRGMIDEKIRGRLDASDGKFGDGAQILREVIPEVRETLEALGTSNRTTPQMGFGPAPGGQGADIYPTKMPDHVPSTEAGFEEHIAQVLQHNQFKAQQGS